MGIMSFICLREVIEEDSILNEDVQSKFGDSYQVEMYIENTDGFEGEGDLMSKFGLQIRDQATFIISLRTWERFISLDDNLATSFRPNEGDLIYFPLSGSMFEIKFVEHEDPFYQVGNYLYLNLNVNCLNTVKKTLIQVSVISILLKMNRHIQLL